MESSNNLILELRECEEKGWHFMKEVWSKKEEGGKVSETALR